MKKTFCDVCKDELIHGSNVWRIDISIVREGDSFEGPYPTVYPSQLSELCDACMSKLEATVHEHMKSNIFDYTKVEKNRY